MSAVKFLQSMDPNIYFELREVAKERELVLHIEQRLQAPGALNSLENVATIYSLEGRALTMYYLQNYSYPVAQSKANETICAKHSHNIPR